METKLKTFKIQIICKELKTVQKTIFYSAKDRSAALKYIRAFQESAYNFSRKQFSHKVVKATAEELEEARYKFNDLENY